MNDLTLWILFAGALCTVFCTGFLLGRSDEVTGGELQSREPRAAFVGRWYPVIQIAWVVVVAVLYYIFSICLGISDSHRLFSLAAAWFASIGILDGLIALNTHVFPSPHRWGYRYVYDATERSRAVSVFQLVLAVGVTLVTVSWSLRLW